MYRVNVLEANDTWKSLKTGSCHNHSKSSSLCTVRRGHVRHDRPSCRPGRCQPVYWFVPSMCHKHTKLAAACNPVTEGCRDMVNHSTLSIIHVEVAKLEPLVILYVIFDIHTAVLRLPLTKSPSNTCSSFHRMDLILHVLWLPVIPLLR